MAATDSVQHYGDQQEFFEMLFGHLERRLRGLGIVLTFNDVEWDSDCKALRFTPSVAIGSEVNMCACDAANCGCK